MCLQPALCSPSSAVILVGVRRSVSLPGEVYWRSDAFPRVRPVFKSPLCLAILCVLCLIPGPECLKHPNALLYILFENPMVLLLLWIIHGFKWFHCVMQYITVSCAILWVFYIINQWSTILLTPLYSSIIFSFTTMPLRIWLVLTVKHVKYSY